MHFATLRRGAFGQTASNSLGAQTTTPGVTFPTPCKKGASSLTRPATQYREEAGHEKYSLLSLTRMSNQLQIS